uniref:Dimer_Tnp_hAT domain-containing protein n=1 Tax=Rhabditophanes sp. KR3021 TaxID=114890 RepID=A0AC35UBN8_9BILA
MLPASLMLIQWQEVKLKFRLFAIEFLTNSSHCTNLNEFINYLEINWFGSMEDIEKLCKWRVVTRNTNSSKSLNRSMDKILKRNKTALPATNTVSPEMEILCEEALLKIARLSFLNHVS